jgi:hypothetical protein
LEQLARNHGNHFFAIIVVAHSAESAIKVASDMDPVVWDAFARYLAPFAPEHLVLVACRAGRTRSLGPLFSELPTLRGLLVSPVTVGIGQGIMMSGLFTKLIDGRGVRKDLLKLIRVLVGLGEGGQVWQWTRKEWERAKTDPIAAGAQDLAADLGRHLWESLKRQ